MSSSTTTIQFSESHTQASNLTPVKQTVTVLPISNTGGYHYTTPSRQLSTSHEPVQLEQSINPVGSILVTHSSFWVVKDDMWHPFLWLSRFKSKNYINWANTHLKKRPGVKLIENLLTDMRDVVALIHLIEVICKYSERSVNLGDHDMRCCENYFYIS